MTMDRPLVVKLEDAPEGAEMLGTVTLQVKDGQMYCTVDANPMMSQSDLADAVVRMLVGWKAMRKVGH